MSKEEIILQQQILKYPNKYIYQVAITAMKIHADQEKEKVAVAFGNWLKETILDGDVPALYQYFIEKVYN